MGPATFIGRLDFFIDESFKEEREILAEEGKENSNAPKMIRIQQDRLAKKERPPLAGGLLATWLYGHLRPNHG